MFHTYFCLYFICSLAEGSVPALAVSVVLYCA